ncbi:ATP-binding protein [Nostoc sp. LEGE 12447]|uniref:ATP-binding protein n=1 Tax=Nostoc sp. LEGE 12447 TaxID=1828640 RepID=UPI0018839984|nr:ATP-binding protein [Nostoc sp. LEGE 12447]MBE9000334.1 ATP-binding protein [Nostoc sp. LEGE 12447]
MTRLNGFPLELLTQPTTERLAYFKDYTVAHPRLKEVYEILMRTIAEPAGASFIFVYGPSGIGKTTLWLRVEQKLKELALPKLESDRARVPVVGIEAVAPESRYFNWKEYYTRALITLEEPLIDHKFDYGVRGISRDNFGKISVESKVVAPALRRALENALIHRHPDVFFVDEAQHFGKVASGYKLQDQLDCLKSLANMTGILHCLLGTYELLTFRNLSGQLSRRSVDIHFRRYCADSPEDVQAFKSVLLTFQQHLPLAETPNLVDHWEYFYERTLGCIGTLKDWLTRALNDALDREATTITLKDLQKRALSVAQCQKMFKEIQEGERQLSETEADVQNLRSLLGLRMKPIGLPEETPKTTRPPGKVGKRKPKRDPIGVQQDVN